jgi:hypothetical protein
MLEICILVDCIVFGLRVYYYQRASGYKEMASIFSSFNRFFSFEYLLPMREIESDSTEVANWKRKSNMFLNLFYISLVFTFILVGLKIKNVLGR